MNAFSEGAFTTFSGKAFQEFTTLLLKLFALMFNLDLRLNNL